MPDYVTNDVYFVCPRMGCEYKQEFPEEINKHWKQHHSRETAKDWVFMKMVDKVFVFARKSPGWGPRMPQYAQESEAQC